MLYQFEKPMATVKSSLDKANESNSEEDIDKTIDDMVSALKDAGTGLASVRELCNKSQYRVSATDKASIDSQKAIISGSQTAIVGLESDISLLRSQNSANITAAQSGVDSAKSVLDIQKASYNSLVADPRQIDLEGIKASIKEAEAAYKLIAENREKAFIRAPFSGTVSNIPFKENNLISSGQTIASLVNKDGLQVKAYISEKEKEYIENGAAVSFGEGLEGIVANISPSVNDTTKKIEIIIAITSDKAPFTIGEYVESKISTKRDLVGSDKFLLPLKAVKLGNDKAYVYVLDGEIVEEKEVTLGKVVNESIEVLEGLSMGDNIISSVRGIKAGEKVKVKN
jgi:RND family efflux transporter MFP subunit